MNVSTRFLPFFFCVLNIALSEQKISLKPTKGSSSNIMKQCATVEDKSFKAECIKIAKLYRRNSRLLKKKNVEGFKSIFLKAPESCPTLNSVKSTSGYNLRSLSPWTYHINYDRKRFPNIIYEAKCLCKGCINAMTGEEDFAFSSRPITIDVPVIRTTSDETDLSKCKRRNCNTEVATVAIGCFCIAL